MASVVLAVSWTGWGLLLLGTFLISHFHLFGLTQGLLPVAAPSDLRGLHPGFLGGAALEERDLTAH